MNVYLSGPMRGIKNFNSTAFNAAAKKLRMDGYFVFNPAEKDVEKYGKDVCKSKTGDEQEAVKKSGFNLRDALGADLAWICATADAIALLPGWENSKGVAAEFAAARALGLVIFYLDEDHNIVVRTML